MAVTRCGRCQGGLFEVQAIEPSGGTYKVISVQCSSCGTPIGITTYYDPGVLLQNQAQKIQALTASLAKVERSVRQMEQILSRQR